MKKYQVKVGELNREVTLVSCSRNEVCFELDGKFHRVVISEAGIDPSSSSRGIQVPTSCSTAKVGNTGIGHVIEIRAPMPGLVGVINVSVGDLARQGACLLVLEAMKMENPIVAERGGVVESIHVRSGVEVAANELLICLRIKAG